MPKEHVDTSCIHCELPIKYFADDWRHLDTSTRACINGTTSATPDLTPTVRFYEEHASDTIRDITKLREYILKKATTIVTQDRNDTHGEPEDSFGQIASVLSSLGYMRAGRVLSASDVAIIMIALKLVRATHNRRHEDSWIDIAGYSARGAECATGEHQQHLEAKE